MKVLMLDVDGVLVNGRPKDGQHLFTDLEADLGLSPDLLQKEFFKPFWEAIVTGRATLPDRLAPVLSRIAPHLPAQTLIDYWFANDSRIDVEVLDAVSACRSRGVRVFLATNQEHLRANYLMQNMKLAYSVDGILYSAALGSRKPEPEFYRLATIAAAIPPGDILLVDDTEKNVDAARAAGWLALHWQRQGRFGDVLREFIDE